MAFTPTSTVYLLGTPLDNKYKNQILFRHQVDQLNYFRDCRKHTFPNVSYQRKDNSIRVEKHIDELWDSNYVQYQNTNFGTKWFYAFITSMKYVSEKVTEIFIETDVFQTWLFECSLKDSFVVREHVDDDKIGLHLIDEQLEYGEYKLERYNPVGLMGASWNILATSDNTPLGVSAPVGNIYGNVMTGLTYFPFPNTSQGVAWLKETILTYAQAGKPDAIVMLFTVPRFLIASTIDDPSWTLGEPISTGTPYAFDFFSTTKNIATVDGYTPKNKKLHAFPYKCLYMSNSVGQSATYRYEDFSTYAMEFMLVGSVCPSPTIMLAPSKYKGVEDLSFEHGLTLSGYPMGSWTSDQYTAWFAQNGMSVGVGMVASAVSIIGGAVAGSPIAIAGGVIGIASEMAQIQKASTMPDQARGQLNNGSLMYGQNSLDFYYAHMTIKKEYAEKIDNFLTMFGYKVNALKVPETKSRYYWNYVKTIDVNINGTIPDDDMEKLKGIYNEGVTLWHDPNYFLNYGMDNAIGDLYQTAPTLVSATTNEAGTEITMTFSENMQSPEFKVDEFTLKVDNVERTITTMELNSDTKKYTVHYTPAVQQLETITISYTKGTILSADKGVLASFTNRTVTNGVPVDPTLVNAVTSTNGSTIVLTFDKNMINPIGTEYEWEVKADDVNVPITSIVQDSESAKYILTLQTNILIGQVVKTGYTRGTIKSADNGILRSYYGVDVTNNAVALTPTLLSIATNTTGNQVILTLDKDMANPSGKQSEFSVKSEVVKTPILPSGYNHYVAYRTTTGVDIIVFTVENPQLYKYGTLLTTKLSSISYKYSTTYNVNEGTYGTLQNASSGEQYGFNDITTIYLSTTNVYTNSSMGTISFVAKPSIIDLTTYTVSSVALDTDIKKIILNLSTSIAYGKPIKASYNGIDVVTTQGGKLAQFTDISVMNNVPKVQQEWSNFASTPATLPLASYPYQFIWVYNTIKRLYVSSVPFFVTAGSVAIQNSINAMKYSNYDGTNWGTLVDATSLTINGIMPQQANSPIYTDSTLTNVVFAKTTA